MSTKRKFAIPKIEELSKESDYVFGVFTEAKTDLSCVLIATSFLESELASMLKCHLIEENDIVSHLFDPMSGGALSTLAARSDMAYCLGLITEGFRKNLKVIGIIRNKFAHGYSPLDLNDPDITKLVDSLTVPRAYKTLVDRDGKSKNSGGWLPFEQLGTRSKFTVIVIFMISRLLQDGRAMKHRKKENTEWE